jgi:hypothetical protein
VDTGFFATRFVAIYWKNHGLGTAPQRDRVVNMDASSTPSARLGICCKVDVGKEAAKQGDRRKRSLQHSAEDHQGIGEKRCRI